MKSQTSLVAQQTRLNEWAEQIKECQNRPQGMNEYSGSRVPAVRA